jgi:hypothetical protein
MAIEDLLAVCPAPDRPIQVGSIRDLEAIEQQLGTRLPADYLDFALRYGSGSFVGTFLHIWNPFADNLFDETTNENGCGKEKGSGVFLKSLF